MIRWAFGTDNWLDWVEAHKSNAITPEIEMRLRSNGGRPNIQPFANFIGSNAYSLARMHRVPEAIRVAKAALIVSPNDYWLNFLAGELVYRSDPQQAVRYWENALKFNPYYTECAVTLAHERVREGQFAAAVSLLTSVQKALGTHGNPWLDMADAKIGLHDLSGAMQALDKAEQAQLPANPTEIASRRKRIQDILAFEGGKRP
jgi:tetratricopeptide (TPR) repeat protein